MSIKRVFLAWGRIGRRTKELAKILNARIIYIPDKPPYLKAWFKTSRMLRRVSPKTVIVQLPQGPLLLRVIMLKKKIEYNLVADVHTGFSVYESWKNLVLNKPFHRLLFKCDLVLAHNDPFKEFLVRKKGLDPRRVLTVYDPFPEVPNRLIKPKKPVLEPYKYIIFPAAWDPDEPLDFIIREYLSSSISSKYKLVITGNYVKGKRILSRISPKILEKKIVLTGYLSIEEYYWAIKYSKLVVTGTTREYTMLSSIWEALALEKPFVTSFTNTLYNLLGREPWFFYRLVNNSLRKALERYLNQESNLEILSFKAKQIRNKLFVLSAKSIRLLNRLLSFLEA